MKDILADGKTQRKRLEICRACPHKKAMICGKCGCIIRAKVTIKSTQCPVGKW